MENYLTLYQGDNAIFNLGTNNETSINLLWNKISTISNCLWQYKNGSYDGWVKSKRKLR